MKKPNKTYCTGSLANLHPGSGYATEREAYGSPTHLYGAYPKTSKYMAKPVSSQEYLRAPYQPMRLKRQHGNASECGKEKRLRPTGDGLVGSSYFKKRNVKMAEPEYFDRSQRNPQQPQNEEQVASTEELRDLITQILMEYKMEGQQVYRVLKNATCMEQLIRLTINFGRETERMESNQSRNTAKFSKVNNRDMNEVFDSFTGDKSEGFKRHPKFPHHQTAVNWTTRADGYSEDYFSCNSQQQCTNLNSPEEIVCCKNSDVHELMLRKISQQNCKLQEKEQEVFYFRSRVQEVQNQKLRYKLVIQKLQNSKKQYDQRIRQMNSRISFIERTSPLEGEPQYQSLDASFDHPEMDQYRDHYKLPYEKEYNQQRKKNAYVLNSQRSGDRNPYEKGGRTGRNQVFEDFPQIQQHSHIATEPVALTKRNIDQLSVKLDRLQKMTEDNSYSTFQHHTSLKKIDPQESSPKGVTDELNEIKSEIQQLEVIAELNELRNNQSSLLDQLCKRDQMIDRLIETNKQQQFQLDSEMQSESSLAENREKKHRFKTDQKRVQKPSSKTYSYNKTHER